MFQPTKNFHTHYWRCLRRSRSLHVDCSLAFDFDQVVFIIIDASSDQTELRYLLCSNYVDRSNKATIQSRLSPDCSKKGNDPMQIVPKSQYRHIRCRATHKVTTYYMFHARRVPTEKIKSAGGRESLSCRCRSMVRELTDISLSD
jgi:hypothetical protein